MSGRRTHLPALGVVVPRPRGVFWALAAPVGRIRFCQAPEHAVYATDTQREKKGQPGEIETVRCWACAECWPQTAQPKEAE